MLTSSTKPVCLHNEEVAYQEEVASFFFSDTQFLQTLHQTLLFRHLVLIEYFFFIEQTELRNHKEQ